MLEPLGIDATTESVYRALLQEPQWSLADIATRLALSEEEVRRRLDRLAELSLLRTSPREPAEVLVVSPEVGLANLLVDSQADLIERQRQVERMRGAIAAIADEYRAIHARDHSFRRFERPEAARARMDSLAYAARFEYLAFLPVGVETMLSAETMESSRRLDQLVRSRGVQLRSIYQESLRNDPPTLRHARWFADMGGETRTVPVLTLQMVIVDREVALVPLRQLDSHSGAVEVHGEGIIAALLALFEQTWTLATPLDKPPAPESGELSSRDQALLRLLADGCTDENAARQLGTSLRTVRRMTSSLLARLEARSRFQAGVRAAQRRWI